MAGQTNIVRWASGPNALLQDIEAYKTKAQSGLVPGIADLEQANRSWLQATAIAAAVAAAITKDGDHYTGVDVNDNETDEQIMQKFMAAICGHVPYEIKDGAISGGKLADGGVTTIKIGAKSVTAEKMAANAIAVEAIQSGAVTEDKLAPNAVAASKINALAVTSEKINTKAVTTEKLADGAVNGDKIANNAVSADKIVAGAVVDGKLGSNSVNTVNIKDGHVTDGKLGANSVNTSNIKDGHVTFAKMASAAIATTEEGKAGTASNKLMTPQATRAAISAQIPPAVPAGVMVHYVGTTAPDGWLVCNGAAVSRTQFAALFAVLGTKCGTGDGSTTFNLPNMHHRFFEGTTTTSEVGQSVSAGLPNITGEFQAESWNITGYHGAFYIKQEALGGAGYDDNSSHRVNMSASRSSNLYGNASTVQPASLRSMIIIKS